jgi:DNA-binding Lrp family transcriptional regulator/YHS domain-containing protein
VTTPTVSARVARLERLGLVRGYTVVLNTEALLAASSLLLVRPAPRATATLMAWLASQAEVAHVYGLADGRIACVATFMSLQEERELLERIAARQEVQQLEPLRILAAGKEEPRARLTGPLRVALPCDQCRKIIDGAPVRRKLDGREHYFCCATCDATFVKRLERAKAGLGGKAVPAKP